MIRKTIPILLLLLVNSCSLVNIKDNYFIYDKIPLYNENSSSVTDRNITLYNNYLFYCDYGIKIVDMSSNYEIINEMFDITFRMSDILFNDKYGIIIGIDSIRLIDVEDIMNIVIINTIPLFGEILEVLRYNDEYLVLTRENGMFYLNELKINFIDGNIDVINKINVPISMMYANQAIGSSHFTFINYGNTIYLWYDLDSCKLAIFDNTSNVINYKKTINFEWSDKGMAIYNEQLYCANRKEVYIYSLSDPLIPKYIDKVTKINPNNFACNDLVIKNNNLYIASSGLTIIDLENNRNIGFLPCSSYTDDDIKLMNDNTGNDLEIFNEDVIISSSYCITIYRKKN
jgi:hypothetical protein